MLDIFCFLFFPRTRILTFLKFFLWMFTGYGKIVKSLEHSLQGHAQTSCLFSGRNNKTVMRIFVLELWSSSQVEFQKLYSEITAS